MCQISDNSYYFDDLSDIIKWSVHARICHLGCISGTSHVSFYNYLIYLQIWLRLRPRLVIFLLLKTGPNHHQAVKRSRATLHTNSFTRSSLNPHLTRLHITASWAVWSLTTWWIHSRITTLMCNFFLGTVSKRRTVTKRILPLLNQ